MNPLPETQTPPPSPNAGVWPDGLGNRELQDLLRSVLKDRWGLNAEYFSEREEGGAPLPLERMLIFEDPAPGVLMVRGDARIEGMLSAGDKAGDREWFTELAVRVWREMVHRFFDQNVKDLKPCRLRNSRHSDWPHREPELSCLFMVGRVPLEARLWMGEGVHRNLALQEKKAG